MNTSTSNTILATALATFLAAPAATAQKPAVPVPAPPEWQKADPAAYGRQLAFYQDRHSQGWLDEVTRGEMTLFDAGGDSVRRTYSRMSLERVEEGDKTIIRFLSPADIKGVAALTHENPGSSDDNWLYLPANKRVRRVSGANNTASFQGTEFTYEDLSTIDPREYRWRFEAEAELDRDGEKVPVFKLDAEPTYADTGYSRIVLYVNRDLWRQERIDYYDKAGRLLKIREARKWRHLHGRFWREEEMEMRNLQTGKRTVLKQTQIVLDLSRYESQRSGKPRPNLTEAQFTTRAIKR